VIKRNFNKEESVPPIQHGPRPFEHGKLLSEGENLESGIASIAKEDSEGGHE
jgi:hypothetical protein